MLSGMIGKTLFVALLSLGMLASLSGDTVEAQSIRIFIDDQEVQMVEPPASFEQTTFVPLRGIFEHLGITVSWDGSSETVTALKGSHELEYRVGSFYAYLNGERLQLSSPGRKVDGTTMVPLRFISQSFGAEVLWDNGIIRITSDAKLLETAAVAPSAETVSNMNNGGFLVKDGEWLYGLESEAAGPLYKIQTDGTHKQLLLSDKEITSLTVKGEWLYFVSEGFVNKMKTDGSSLERLTEGGSTSQAYLLNDWLFYNEGGELFRAKMNETASTPIRIVEGSAYSEVAEFSISGDWVYYRIYDRKERHHSLGRIRINGTDNMSYGKINGSDIVPYGEYVYFQYREGRASSVGRMPVEGGAVEQVIKGAYHFHISNGALYYLRNTTLYVADLDGGNARKSVELNEWSLPKHFLLIDNDLYYEDNAAGIYGMDIKKEVYSVNLTSNVTRSVFGTTVHKSYSDAITSDKHGNSYTLLSDSMTEIYDAAKLVVAEHVRAGMSDREKVKALHDYVVTHTAYDYHNFLGH